MDDIKFKFTTDFQEDILKYTVSDSNGYKAIEMYDDTYFTLIEHSIIAYTLKKYYKNKKRIPGKTVFIQELLKTFDHRDFRDSITPDDRDNIVKIAKHLFDGGVQDGNDIIENVERFTQFVDLKHVIENVNLLDYNGYEPFSRKVQKAISPRLQALEERGSFLSRDVVERQVRRRDLKPIVPMPFKQLNKLTNANGYIRGSVMVILDRAKKFKTGMLVNIAVGYYKRNKNVLFIDLDNGEDEVMLRIEQCLMELEKKDVLSEKYNKAIVDKFKGRKREIIVKKMPALITNASHIEDYIDYLYREFGIEIHELVIDYIGKMASISGKESLHERISEAYIDIGNLAIKKHIEHVWTAQHVTRRAAQSRMRTRYDATDIAGAIDISRHVQAIYGLNRSVEEEQDGYQRLEIVDQRDGKPRGRAVFKVNIETQTAKPLNDEELKKYQEDFYDHLKEVNETEVEDEVTTRKAPGYNKKRKKNDLDKD